MSDHILSPGPSEWLEWPTASFWRPHPDPDVDLTVASVADLQAHAGGRLANLFFSPIWSVWCPTPAKEAEFSAMLGTTMIGYPVGLWDTTNNLPILRRGTTASHPAIDYEGRPEFVIDIAAFPGSSGSPVVVLEEGRAEVFLGLLYAEFTDIVGGQVHITPIPTQGTTAIARTELGVHLGVAIKARVVLDHIQSLPP